MGGWQRVKSAQWLPPRRSHHYQVNADQPAQVELENAQQRLATGQANIRAKPQQIYTLAKRAEPLSRALALLILAAMGPLLVGTYGFAMIFVDSRLASLPVATWRGYLMAALISLVQLLVLARVYWLKYLAQRREPEVGEPPAASDKRNSSLAIGKRESSAEQTGSDQLIASRRIKPPPDAALIEHVQVLLVLSGATWAATLALARDQLLLGQLTIMFLIYSMCAIHFRFITWLALAISNGFVCGAYLLSGLLPAELEQRQPWIRFAAFPFNAERAWIMVSADSLLYRP